jgi:hypothetical protein
MLKALKVIALVLVLITTNAYAKNQLEVIYEPSKQYDSVRQSLQSSEALKELFSTLNENFKFPKGLKIVFSNAEDTAYDPETNKILVNYDFAQEIEDIFTKAKAEIDGKPKEAAIQALMYMIIHELAHALIHNYDLPIVGKEEDAADSLASVLLSEYFEGGQEAVLDAATFFDLVSADRKELTDEDFFDEHSLDEQRLYNALCYVYGSDPKKYADVKKIAGFPTERAELCKEDYAKLADSWDVLLAPYVKKP